MILLHKLERYPWLLPEFVRVNISSLGDAPAVLVIIHEPKYFSIFFLFIFYFMFLNTC
jgi:hypothetical protein